MIDFLIFYLIPSYQVGNVTGNTTGKIENQMCNVVDITKMKILRIQNDQNQGFFYFKTLTPSSEEWYYQQSKEWQTPCCDEGTALQKAYFKKEIDFNSPYYFGFVDKKYLYTWFRPEYLGIYYAHGFSVWMYEIPKEHVIFGSQQVVFDIRHVTNKMKLNSRQLRQF